MKALQPLTSIDNTFLHDVKDWFSCLRSGHMIRHYYSDKALLYWEAFTRFSTDYYLFDEESKLIQDHAKELSSKYRPTGEIIAVELGTGSIKSAYQKTLPFLKAFQPSQYIATDWSEESAGIVSAIVEKELRIKNDRRIIDFNTDNLNLPNKKKVFFQFGSTISNIESLPLEGIPFSKLVSNLKNYQNNMGHDDILVIGLDQNNDRESLLKSYSHPSHKNFSESILHKIKAELPVSKNFKPSDFDYEPIWIPENHQLMHALVANTFGDFVLDGTSFSYRKGDIFSYDNSFKYPQNIWHDAAFEAGLNIVETVCGDRVSLQVLKQIN